MGKVVNLRRFRKNQERAQRQASAVQARLKSGRTRAERIIEESLADQVKRRLDAHRLEGEG